MSRFLSSVKHWSILLELMHINEKLIKPLVLKSSLLVEKKKQVTHLIGMEMLSTFSRVINATYKVL